MHRKIHENINNSLGNSEEKQLVNFLLFFSVSKFCLMGVFDRKNMHFIPDESKIHPVVNRLNCVRL